MDWDLGGALGHEHWDKGMQWVWDAPGWRDTLGFGCALGHGEGASLGKEGALGLWMYLGMRVQWDMEVY